MSDARIVELEREVADARRQIEASGRVYGMVQQASAELVAENARLREAMEAALRDGAGPGKSPNATVQRIHARLRTALSKEGE